MRVQFGSDATLYWRVAEDIWMDMPTSDMMVCLVGGPKSSPFDARPYPREPERLQGIQQLGVLVGRLLFTSTIFILNNDGSFIEMFSSRLPNATLLVPVDEEQVDDEGFEVPMLIRPLPLEKHAALYRPYLSASEDGATMTFDEEVYMHLKMAIPASYARPDACT